MFIVKERSLGSVLAALALLAVLGWWNGRAPDPAPAVTASEFSGAGDAVADARQVHQHLTAALVLP